MREVARKHGITLLQLACLWNLAHPAVESVIPTLIQESDGNGKTIETKVDELAALPRIELSNDERDMIGEIGDNKGCMALKGANRSHEGEPEADKWGLNPDLLGVADRWGIDPDRDLALTPSH